MPIKNYEFQGQMPTNGSLTKNGGNEYFSVPGHTPVIFSEVGGRTLYRFVPFYVLSI